MASVTICSDFGAPPPNKVCHCFHCFPIYLPWSVSDVPPNLVALAVTWVPPLGLLVPRSQPAHPAPSFFWFSALWGASYTSSKVAISGTPPRTTLLEAPVGSLPLNTLSRFVIAFLPRSKHLLISWLQSPVHSDFGVGFLLNQGASSRKEKQVKKYSKP